MTGREIPDLPPGDYRFIAIITLDGHGRPRQVEKEYRQALENLLYQEFGKLATLTRLLRTPTEDEREDSEEDTLLIDDSLELIDSSDDPVVED